MENSRIAEQLESIKSDTLYSNQELCFLENNFTESIDFSIEVFSETKLFELLNSDPATSNTIKKESIESVDFSEEIYSEDIFFELLYCDPSTSKLSSIKREFVPLNSHPEKSNESNQGFQKVLECGSQSSTPATLSTASTNSSQEDFYTSILYWDFEQSFSDSTLLHLLEAESCEQIELNDIKTEEELPVEIKRNSD